MKSTIYLRKHPA